MKTPGRWTDVFTAMRLPDGDVVRVRFQLRFVIPSAITLERIAVALAPFACDPAALRHAVEQPEFIAAFLSPFVTGWRGINDDDGQPVAFSLPAFNRLVCHGHVEPVWRAFQRVVLPGADIALHRRSLRAVRFTEQLIRNAQRHT